MGLFGSPKIDGEELRQCLDYIREESEVIALQSKEADIFNNAMIECGNSIKADSSATKAAAKALKTAAKRLSSAATEILKQHNEVKNVPVAASTMHSAWNTAFLSNRAYASSMVKALEGNPLLFLASGVDSSPETKTFEQRSIEFREAYQNAQDELRKLLNRLKIDRMIKAVIEARAAGQIGED